MKCPVCDESKMKRLPYEGVPLFHCGACHGHLLFRDQVDALKRRRQNNEEQLESEANDVASPHGELRCPKCLGPMKAAPSSKHSNVIWDHCPGCDLVWLDAGELAKIQLERESMLQAHEYEEMRDRWKNKPTNEITEFQKQLAERTELLAEAAARKQKPVGLMAKTMSFFFPPKG